jgi:hypothetical protein
MAKTHRPYAPEQDLLPPPGLRDGLPEQHLAYFVSDLIDHAAQRGGHIIRISSIGGMAAFANIGIYTWSANDSTPSRR